MTGRVVEIAAPRRATRASGWQHGRVFTNRKGLGELLAAVKLVWPHLQDQVCQYGAARIEEGLDHDLRAVREDHVQRLILAVVEERDRLVGNRSEVDLHGAGKAGVHNIGLAGLRLDE